MKLAKQIAIGLHTESKTEKPQRLADIFKSAGAKRQGPPRGEGQMTPRFILIERNSGFIWGDSAHFGPDAPTPIDAARLLDESIGEHGYRYEETNPNDDRTSYDVYRAADGFPVINDGQDQKMIDAVSNECKFVMSIRHWLESEDIEA